MASEKRRQLADKKKALIDNLRRHPNIAVALSGGIDSSLLLTVAHQVHGDRLIAMTGRSPIHPGGEKEASVVLAKQIGVRHILFDTHELDDPAFVRNGKQRCYYCKLSLFRAMRQIAREEGITVLAHGANIDDLNDFRPGFQASRELDIAAPLVDAGISKTDIREMARQMGLPNWDRPAMACLATRVAYGIPIDAGLLGRIDQAEGVMREMGITACRVRHHGHMARIEVPPSQIARLLEPQCRKAIVGRIQKLGYHHVALDLEGYVSGKMNRDLVSPE
jgi:uncharacterized protein